MLKRKMYDALLRWKRSHSNECLLICGARRGDARAEGYPAALLDVAER